MSVCNRDCGCCGAACGTQTVSFHSSLTIVLAGNPNCGKSTVFNLLTGARQTVGNWPGVTVEKHSGWTSLGCHRVEVVDLPGVYSLLGGGGLDQSVARDFLTDGKIDVIVNIVDASNLERHLTLTAELAEIGRPMVLVLNMVDEAQALGLETQVDALEKALGVPVVAMVARKGQGRAALLQAIQTAVSQKTCATKMLCRDETEQALSTLVLALPDAQNTAAKRLNAMRLLENRAQANDETIQKVVQQVQHDFQAACNEDLANDLITTRFAWAQEMASVALKRAGKASWRQTFTDKLDKLVLNDWLGVPIFLLVLYTVFVVSYNGGMIFQDAFDQISAAIFIDGFGKLLWSWGTPEWLIAVLAGGVGGGINLVASFIPPIGITFLFLAILDDCGYMARAAYVLDYFMRRLGLPGNALVPMIIGFGCNVPAVMGSRIVEDPRGRILTVLMQPFMSCSARLTIYMAFAMVFFRENGGQIVFLLYVLGIVAALFTAWLVGKTALRGSVLPFVMELPSYRLPSVRSVLMQAWQRLKIFISRVGRVIVVVGVILFILPGIGITQQGLGATDVDDSLLADLSRTIVPIFQPMGIERDNWAAVSGLVAGVAAKEIVIGTFNGIHQRRLVEEETEKDYQAFDLSESLKEAVRTIPENFTAFFNSFTDPLSLRDINDDETVMESTGMNNATMTALAQHFTPLSAFAYLLFTLLYVPCASTLGALRREIGWGWTIFATGYGLALAWTLSVGIYQIGTFSAHAITSSAWLIFCVALMLAFWFGLKQYGKKYKDIQAA